MREHIESIPNDPFSTTFIVRTTRTPEGSSFHYHCGSCGSLLLDAGTKEVLDCVFHCVECGELNEGHAAA